MAASAAKKARTGRRLLNTLLISQPLILAGLYVSNILFLSAVFDAWGMNGAQLFTLQDAVVPGFFINYLLIAALVLPWVIGSVFSWRPRSRKGRVGIRIIAWCLLVTAWVMSVFADEAWRVYLMLAAGSVGALLVLDAWSWRRSTFWPRVWVAAAAVVCATGSLVWTGIAYKSLIDLVADVGLARGLALTEADAPCAGPVLWLGERVVVVRCSDKRADVGVMTTGDDLKFIRTGQASGQETMSEATTPSS